VLTYTNANVSGLLGWSEGEKWKRSLLLITKPESCIPSWTLTTTITIFHMMSHYSSPSPSNLDPQASSDAFSEQEMRAWFTKLGLDWGSGDEAPLEERACQPSPVGVTGLLSSMAAQAIALEFSIPTQVFKEPTVTLPSPTPAKPLAGGAQQPIDPCNIPLGVKQVGKRSLSGNLNLSVFDILSSFHCCWFLSVNHLRAQALSAQKAEDGKIFWVEFTPPFHTHLVKCAVALVPQPIEKVKKVMFMHILELLNRGGPQTFFNLTKSQQLVTQAQKEKW
jgi:hypothetical protein